MGRPHRSRITRRIGLQNVGKKTFSSGNHEVKQAVGRSPTRWMDAQVKVARSRWMQTARSHSVRVLWARAIFSSALLKADDFYCFLCCVEIFALHYRNALKA